MGLTKEQEKKLEQNIRTELKKQYNNGLKGGIAVASRVVLDMLNDSSKSLMDRVNSVKDYCRTGASIFEAQKSGANLDKSSKLEG